MVPASLELNVYAGVVSVAGVVTAVTSAITGAVVSVVVDALSSLLLQEMTVRLKRDMRIMYKIFFIFFSFKHSNFNLHYTSSTSLVQENYRVVKL